jgi:hypothetical protein
MENVMSELIYKADKELLAEKGLDFPNKMLKNINLGKYGKCDLLHFSKHENNTVFHVDVISCNRDKISMSSFIDLVTCAKGIEKYIVENYGAITVFYFHLIAKEIDSKSNIVFLTDVLSDNVNFYQYHVNINGLYFEKMQGFELPSEDLIKPKKKKITPKLTSLQALRESIKLAK